MRQPHPRGDRRFGVRRLVAALSRGGLPPHPPKHRASQTALRSLLFFVAALALVFAFTLAAVQAAGFAHTFAIGSGAVAVTNSQANSSWVPVSVMLRYDGPSSGRAEVRRDSQGHSFVLAATAFTNTSTLVWVPNIAYPFNQGDVLVIESSATNGVVQVLRRSGP